jgi:hypothetical protein
MQEVESSKCSPHVFFPRVGHECRPHWNGEQWSGSWSGLLQLAVYINEPIRAAYWDSFGCSRVSCAEIARRTALWLSGLDLVLAQQSKAASCVATFLISNRSMIQALQSRSWCKTGKMWPYSSHNTLPSKQCRWKWKSLSTAIAELGSGVGEMNTVGVHLEVEELPRSLRAGASLPEHHCSR